jgi:hypothetical protein
MLNESKDLRNPHTEADADACDQRQDQRSTQDRVEDAPPPGRGGLSLLFGDWGLAQKLCPMLR